MADHAIQCVWTSDDGDVTKSYKYANRDYDAADVKAFMEAMVTNTAALGKKLTGVKSATLITTEKSTIDIT